jgi:hypothetical protein
MVGILCLMAWGANAEDPTPLTAPLTPGETHLIAAAPPGAEGAMLFHYRLWLPDDYDADPTRRYPVMFIAGPMGNVGMGEMADRLMRERWIVVMLVESRNGSNAWQANFVAAHDDVLQRVRADESMRFCTGLSGAAKVCSVYPGLRPGFRGVILQAAGPWGPRVYEEEGNTEAAVYGTFGAFDFNLSHAGRVRRGLPPSVRHMVEVWDGRHAWAPAAVFDRALDWVLAAVMIDAPVSPEAYRWYVANRLSELQGTEQTGRRLYVLRALAEIAGKAGAMLEQSLRAQTEAALSDASDPAEEASLQGYFELFARDAASRGNELLVLADAYAEHARRHPGTYGAELADIRYRSLYWEMRRDP